MIAIIHSETIRMDSIYLLRNRKVETGVVSLNKSGGTQMFNFDPIIQFLEFLKDVPVSKWLVFITVLALLTLLVAIVRLT